MNGITDEIEELDCLIKAAENWSPQYGKDADNHAKLIRLESRIERKLRAFFKEVAAHNYRFINWGQYSAQVRAYDVDVLVNDDGLDTEMGLTFNVMFEDITTAVVLGAQASEAIYHVPVGLSSTDAIIQQLGKQRVARLIGKRIQPDGSIINNPRAEYNITDTMRRDIRESIKTSLQAGETTDQAAERVFNTIRNPKRAELIAQTETVNAYSAGVMEYGDQSGAVAKEWMSSDTADICATNSNAGIIDMQATFPSGNTAPAAHPRCRCALRLVFPEELAHHAK